MYEVNKKLPIKRARGNDNDDDNDDEDEDGRARSREKRDVPRATLEAFYAMCCCCLVSSEPRKKQLSKTTTTTVTTATNDSEKFAFDKAKFCFLLLFLLFLVSSLCFCLARNALQMSNGCEFRATSKILYYRWAYNIVILLFLSLMIVAAKEILLALLPQGVFWEWLREKCVQCRIIEFRKSLIDDMFVLNMFMQVY